jgi:hypothetical protein
MMHECNTDTLPLILSRYELKDIYNADEAGLAWRQQPEGTHMFRSMARKGKKVCLDNVSSYAHFRQTDVQGAYHDAGRDKCRRHR